LEKIMTTAYKVIAVHVDNSPHLVSRIKLAARWASRFRSHLIGVAATGLPAALYIGGSSASDESLIPQYANLLRESAEKGMATFEANAIKMGAVAFERRMMKEEPAAALNRQARYSDLLVIGQDEAEGPDFLSPATFSDYMALHSITPILIAPRLDEFPISTRRALIAWDGGDEAIRAAHAAIPALTQADAVEIVTFRHNPAPSENGESTADLVAFLGYHGIKADVFEQEESSDVGERILAHAEDIEADLIVMGAYRHTRFREMLLGGATRTVLRSARIPVFVSH
jgi:nucleotide-binding universal stress UspA family protein